MYFPQEMFGEDDMNIPIKRYVEIDGKIDTVVTLGSYTDVNLRDFTWKYIPESTRMGWVQDAPPAKPFIIASEGMLEIANELLAKRREQT